MDLDDFESATDFLDAYAGLIERCDRAGRDAEESRAEVGLLLGEVQAGHARGEPAAGLPDAVRAAERAAQAAAEAHRLLIAEFLDAREQAKALDAALALRRVAESN